MNSDKHPNIDPRLRPAEPEHPMSLDGGVVGGDTAFMFSCLIEELLMGGLEPEALRAMSRAPTYQALYAARCTLGDPRADTILDQAAHRVGVLQCDLYESALHSVPATLTIGATGKGA